MPTLEHNGIVELFRDNPNLALRVIEEIFHIPVPAHAGVRVANALLDQMLPIEFRADLVLEVLDVDGRCVLAIVFESQIEIKERKKYTWVVYMAVSRAERECPAIVMVAAVDADVAAWASQPIDLGLGLGTLEPLVLGRETLPRIVDEQKAREDVELAVLSGMTHGNGTNGEEVLRASAAAILTLDREHAEVYFQIIWNVLRGPMRQALERLIMENRAVEGEPKEWDLVRILRAKIEIEALRENVLRLVARRRLVLTDEQHARIGTCVDRATLDRWFDNAIDAKTADELFR
jgi:hypothetical protein